VSWRLIEDLKNSPCGNEETLQSIVNDNEAMLLFPQYQKKYFYGVNVLENSIAKKIILLLKIKDECLIY